MNFQKVTRASKAAIEKYTKQWKLENADFCFTTLYLWGKHGKILYAEEAGALFFHYDFPDMPEFFLPPVPLDMRTDYTQYIKIAENEMKKMGFKPCFRSVSEPFHRPF